MDILKAVQPILLHLRPLANDFEEAGYRLYLVGGVVRDAVFDCSSNAVDLDLTTDARPEFVRSVLERHATVLWTQGERFGTIGARVAGRAIEITTHRTEKYESTTRKPQVEFGDSLDVDLSRRDFTINAMAISLPDGEFFDPYNGRTAVSERRLETPIDANESFADDPLRMLRAARFLPRFDLQPASGLTEAARSLADRLSVVSQERISAELDRLLEVVNPRTGFDFLVEVDALRHVIPAVSQVSERDQNVAVGLASGRGSVSVRRAGLLYPVFVAGGSDAVRQALRELRYSGEVQTRTERLLESLAAATTTDASERDVRGFVAMAGLNVSTDESAVGELQEPTGVVADLHMLAANVASVVDSVTFDGSFFAQMSEMVRSGSELALSQPLSGHEIIKVLGVSEGPKIGAAKEYLRKQWINTGDFSRSQAVELVEQWGRDNT